MPENKKYLLTPIMVLIVLWILSPTVYAYHLPNDYQYNYKTEGETDFYNRGIQNLNYDGEIPNEISEIYNIIPQQPFNSDYGSNIIAPPDSNTLTNEAIQKAPQNAPVKPAVQASPNETISSGMGGNSSQRLTDHSNQPKDKTTTDYYPVDMELENKNPYSTTSIEKVRYSNGKIGTLRIPRWNAVITAYDGDTHAAMKKGIGHISTTSAWMGNIGLVGHNRGSNDYFKNLKNLEIGDEITYETKLGQRTYIVTYIGRINETDWSKLSYSQDNRLTLLTCVENQPNLRLCVQAIEKQ